MSAWYFDALDARAGLAFASCREANLDTPSASLDGEAVFVAAPAFRPETVASRATALAAARGSFQAGLFIEGAELGFEDLDSLTEFVRRAYLSGGGGDGAGGGGTLPPPPPDRPEGGEGGDPDEEAVEGEGAIEALLAAIRDASDAAELQRTSSTAASQEAWLTGGHQAHFKVPRNLPAEHGLASAAEALLAELIRRCPTWNARMGAPEIGRWWEALQALTSAIHRFGLWETLLKRGQRRDLSASVQWLLRARPQLFPPHFEEILHDRPASPRRSLSIVAWLAAGAPNGDLLEATYWIDHHYPWRWHPVAARAADPFDDLGRWPVSEPIPGVPRERVSLRDWLCFALGAPLSICWTPRRTALLLFAAAHLQRDLSLPGGFGNEHLRSALTNAVAQAAVEWLRRQFPQRAFPQQVEAMLEQSASKRYE